jgi:cell division protein FtsB
MRWLNILLLLILLGLQYRLWIGAGSFAEVVSLNREIDTQRQQNERLIGRNQRLENEVISLKTGLDAVEERARSDLGMLKRGETFYLIVDKPVAN